MQATKHNKLPRIKVLVLAVHIATGGAAWALGQGATIVNGQVSIQQPAPGSQVINASHGAIINWKQLSIGASESMQFIQPSASSAVLNRVTGPGVSQLLGQLKANGNVFLINPNGIVVGGGARIDTNSFIASTLDMTDADFIAGKLRFFAGSAAGKIRNDGMITAGPGGRIALIAPDIENTGIIRAQDGNILLAAGRKLEIASLDLEGVTFEIQAPTDSVLNLGKLLAENGAVRAFAGNLRHSGEIRASRMLQQADGSIVLAGSNDVTLTLDSVTRADGAGGGAILVQSSNGTARVAGALSATGSAGAGGEIQVLGQRVAIDSGAVLDVSGSQGGGQILVGGDFQGRNPDVQNAQRVSVAEGVTLRADATVQGDGGRVIVWADENTRYHGALSAQGGPLGGHGGFAEVSGKANLEFAGTANLGAAMGASGTLLLDPLDILVSSTSGILPTVVDEFADFPSNIVTVAPAALAAVAGNVTLQAERDIYIKNAIALTTPGAGLTMTAGGATYDAGTIYNTAGIGTTAGAVTLRAQAITGSGGISTAGGAVDLLTHGSLNYSGAINSAGGGVLLASETSSVSNAQVNAGNGNIVVTAQGGVSGGSYTTTGSATLTATTGSVSVGDINAAVANLNARFSVNATVSVSDRVNAASTNSSVQVTGDGAGPLRLGTLTSASSISAYSSTGMEQASGGVLTTPSAYFYNDDSSAAMGSLAAPITIAAPTAQIQPRVSVNALGAPAHIAFSGSPTVGELSLAGSVAALGGTTVTGAANLSALTLASAAGVLNASATSTGGFGNGFRLNVNDGAINASNLALPAAQVDLRATGAVTVGTMDGASLYVTARGPVSIGSATTTGSSGIYVKAQSCDSYNYVACTASSPITAGTLNAGTAGPVRLEARDNGDITVTGSLTGSSAYLVAGDTYYTSSSPYYYEQATTNNIHVASATTSGSFTAYNYGSGNLTIDSLAAAGSVEVRAGSTYSVSPYYTQARTTNNVSVTVAEPATPSGDFRVENSGIGNLLVTEAINRPSGGISLSAFDGTVVAASNHVAAYSINVDSGTSSVQTGDLTSNNYDVSVNAGTTLTVGRITSGSPSTEGNVNLTAGGDVLFDAVSASGYDYYGYYGNVNITSYGGSVRTTNSAAVVDVAASNNVTISATDASLGFIGNPSFANPMDIQAGAQAVVSLSVGANIGAASKPVTVDTNGSLIVSTTDGQFHVAATDGMAARSLSTIRLSASAAGIGSGNNSTLTSADLSLTASSDGDTITFGDLVRSAGTLNEFSFAATGGSGLVVGDINFTTAGFNQLMLSAGNGLAQAAPVTASNINAGYINLDGGSGNVTVGNVTASSAVGNSINIAGADIVAGDLDAPSLSVTGNNISLGTVSTSGTHRGYYTGYDYIARLGYSDYVLDELKLTASGDISTSGDIASATSALLTAGGNVTVGGGSGLVTGGGTTICCTYYTDTARVWAGTGSGSVSSGAISAYSVDLMAATIDVGNLSANLSGGTLAVTGTDIGTGAMSAYNTVVTATNLTTGTISGSYINLTSDTFATGNLTAGTALTIESSSGYAPMNVALAVTSGTADITAVGDIVFSGANASSLTAPTVRLTSSGGNVSAALAGTSNLTIDTAVGFNVTSNTWLDTLDVTAQWDQATGAPGSVGSEVRSTTGSGTQFFGYAPSTGLLLSVGSTLDAGRTWNLRYHDVSANPVMLSPVPSSNDYVATFMSHGGAGTVRIGFDSATVFKNTSVSLPGGANVEFDSGGDLDLTSVSTQGGYVSASTGGGSVFLTSVSTGGGSVTATTSGDATKHIHVESVATQGGDVYLESGSGNIVRAGVQPLQIDTRLVGGAPAGTVTLNAPNGSVGAAGTPILTSGIESLNVSARDDIAVDVANTDLTNLTIATGASGAGTIAVTNSNYAGLSVTRVGSNTALALAGLNPSSTGDFSLTATDGDLKVADDIANVGNLTLNANSGNVEIAAVGAGAARSVANSGQLSIQAGQDIVVQAGSGAAETVSVTAGTLQLHADRDIRLAADGASAQLLGTAGAYSQDISAGRDLHIAGGAALNATALLAINGSSSYVNVNTGQDLVVQGGAGTDAAATLSVAGATSYATFNVGRDLTVAGGGASGAFALLENTNTYQQQLNISRDLTLHGGTGAGAYAALRQAYPSFSYQNATIGGNLSVLGGDASSGQGDGAYAELTGWYQSMENIRGSVLVKGGTAADTSALIAAGSDQYLGTYYSSGGSVTDSLSVLGGSGLRAFARTSAAGSQYIYAAKDRANGAATGDITVQGGTGVDAVAEITSGSDQYVGSQTDYCYYYGCYDPTRDLLVQGGAGNGAFASIHAAGYQTVYAGGAIKVSGGAGALANAELLSDTSGQQVGSTSASSNNATDSILVEAGAGGSARILAQLGSQSIMTGGDLSVLGGSGAGKTASIEAAAGSQDIGDTYLYSNDPSGTVRVQGGSGSGAAAWIKASTGQTIDAGGAILLAGGATGAFAEVSTTSGSQSVGNLNSTGSYDQTDSITLTGGSAAGAYAKLSTGANQTIRSFGAVTLSGGTGDASGALMLATSGQDLVGRNLLAITGGSGTTAGGNDSGLHNTTSGNQTLNLTGNISVTGGSTGSDTGILNVGTGSQSITSSTGSLSVLAPAASPNSNGVVGIETGTGAQVISVLNGSVSVDNAGALAAYIMSDGTQSITTRSMAISLSSPFSSVSGPLALVNATGNQTIQLNGTGSTASSATLSVTNLSSQTGSAAALTTDGNQIIRMNYDTAGLVKVGDAAGKGLAAISAGGSLTMVAGQLLLQGGDNAASTATLLSAQTNPLVGDMVISTLYGPVELNGGVAGGAFIDPPLLSITSNGSVLLQAGTNGSSNVNINAGQFDLAATAGNLSLVNSVTSPATATITADTFNFQGPGSVVLAGGTITVTNSGNVDIGGLCINCSTNLIGPFSVRAYVPPPLPPTDYSAIAVADVLALAELIAGPFDMTVDENGNVVATRRRLSQCY